MTSFCPRSFRLLFIGLLAACFVSHQILAQQLSMSLAVSVNGQKVDFSGASDLALALYGSDKQELSLMTGVPPTLQDKLPDGLALALKKETVKDLKAELQAAKDAVNTAQTPEQLMDMLAKAAPETAELLKQLGQVIKQKYQQWKSALGAQELEYVNKLELLLQQKYNELVEKVKQKLDAPTKQQLKDALLAIAGPVMEKLMQIPVVKAQLAVSK